MTPWALLGGLISEHQAAAKRLHGIAYALDLCRVVGIQHAPNLSLV